MRQFIAACGVVAAICFGGEQASAAQIQILDDQGDAGTALTTLFTAHGDTVSALNHDFGSTNLTGDRVVITNVPNGFSSGEISNLKSYVDGGGRLVLVSEGGAFTAAITATNAVLTSLGSSIVNDFSGHQAGVYSTTTDIASNPFTAGVSSIDYVYTSGLSGGTALFSGADGQTIGSYQKIGSGYVFVLADSNVGADVTLTTNSNAQLFLNFENATAGGTIVSAVPLPASAPMFGAALLALGAYGFTMKRKMA